MNQIIKNHDRHIPWNKGKLIGQKSPLKLKEIWAIRIRLQLANRARELSLFNLAIDSKLRGCDLVQLRVCDIAQGNRVSSRACIMQQKTHRPVQFEITEKTRESLSVWISQAHLTPNQYLFPSRIHSSPHLSTRQYARIVEHWPYPVPKFYMPGKGFTLYQSWLDLSRKTNNIGKQLQIDSKLS